jgi:hypothetical protein
MRVDSIVQAHLGSASVPEFQKYDDITVGPSRSVAYPQNEFVEFSNAAHSNHILGYDLSRALNVWAGYTDPRNNRTLWSNELGDFQPEIVCETNEGLWHRACSIDKQLVEFCRKSFSIDSTCCWLLYWKQG